MALTLLPDALSIKTRAVMRWLTIMMVGVLASISTNAAAQIQRSIINPSFEDPAIALGCQGYVYAARVSGWFTTDAPLTSPTADFDNPNGCVGNNGTNPAGGTRVFEYYSNNVVDNQSGLTLLAADGVQFVELNAQTASRLYQNVCLIPGETVTFSFNHLGRRAANYADVARFMLGGTTTLGSGIRIVTAADSNDGSPGSATAGLSTNTVRTPGPSSGGGGRYWGAYNGSFTVPATYGGLQELAFEAVSSANMNGSAGSTAQGNFLDNIQIAMKPTIEFASTSYTMVEGNAANPTVQIKVAGIVPPGGATVSMTITPGTATIGSDYTVNGGSSLTFTATIPAGDYGRGTIVNVVVPIATVNDLILESAETFTVTVNPNLTQYVVSSTTTCNANGAASAVFTIQDNDGTIRIIKDAVPNDAQDFSFATTGADWSAFLLDDDSNATLPNTRNFTLNAGSYTVTEAATAGWSLTNLVCTDPDSGTTVNLSTALATIDLDAGETVICTYTNNKMVPIAVTKTSAPYWDPVNGFTNPKMIPGAIVNYTITVANPGTLPITADSIIAVDPLPNIVSMVVGDFGGAGSGPVSFSPLASGLSYTFQTLASMTDDLDFSSDGVNWTKVATPGASNADTTVTHLRVRPKGTMAAGTTFSFIFRALIE